MKRSDIFGSLEEEWQYKFDELKRSPTLNDALLKIEFKEAKSKFLGMGSIKGKVVTFKDKETAKVCQTSMLQEAFPLLLLC